MSNNSSSLPIMERNPLNGTLAKSQGEKSNTGRVHLCIVRIAKRMLDPDNISPKWIIDCLRSSRIIQGDEPDKITLQVEQRKCAKGEEESTQVWITFP